MSSKIYPNEKFSKESEYESKICPTGVISLDKILGGGLRRKTTTLVAGGAGVGKSTFATQFLLTGVKQYGEAGLLILTETSKGEWLDLMKHMGLDPGIHLGRHLFVEDLSPKDIVLGRNKQNIGLYGEADPLMWIIGELQSRIPKSKPKIKRIAIDSFFPFRVAYKGNDRLFLAKLSILRKVLNKLGLTTMLVSEVKGEYDGSKYTMEEYIGDTIIHLRRNKKHKEVYRTIELSKARFSFREHKQRRYLYKINPGVGIVVSEKIQPYD